MTLTVTSNDKGIRMKLEGSGQMGKPMDEQSNAESHSRGCEILVIGDLHVDEEGKFDRFNLAGVGRAWGNKRKNTQRIIGVEGSSWLYGIACEIVTPQTPADHIPPYNLLHYNGSGKSYFPKR